MFSCRPGCSECCGCIPMSNQLIKEHKERIQVTIEKEHPISETETALITEDLQCVFLDRNNHKCVIYEERPQVCRDFGTRCNAESPRYIMLCCPYQDKNGKPWNNRQKKVLEHRMKLVMEEAGIKQ